MTLRSRDLGRMEYAACWELQRSLFEELLARKRTERAVGTGVASGGQGSIPGPDTTCVGSQRPQQPGREVEKAATASDKPGRADGEEAVAANAADKPGRADGEETAATNAADKPGRADGEEAAAATDASEAGTVLLVEHPPVYTLGKSGRAENLLIGREALEKMGARFFHIDRGGDITFHGPGQLVCYPILDLERLGLGLREYIAALEETVIRTIGRYGIRASRLAGAAGVWIDPENRRPRKICAIGVRSSRYVTMHGFALNVSTDLGWFARINPCGFTDRGVASIESETGLRVEMEEVKQILLEELAAALGCRIEPAF